MCCFFFGASTYMIAGLALRAYWDGFHDVQRRVNRRALPLRESALNE
jgi:hypothetical protein